MTDHIGPGNEKPIHVLEVAGNAIVGGMEKYVYNLVQYLPEHQIKVTCVAPYESFYTASLRNLGSEVFITAMDNDPPWRSIQFLTELVRHQEIDLLHGHLPRAHVLAGLVGKLTNKPVVATIHGMDVTAHELGIARTTGSHLVVVCNDAYAQALNLGMPEERLSLIPNGVDLKLFQPHRSGGNFRKALGLAEHVPLIGFVGRLAWEKGPDQFLRMAEYIHRVHPEIHFALVGEGPMEKDLANLLKRDGQEGYIHLVGLWKNTWEVYPALEIVVQTSRVEGMPFALLEALACGRPVAALGVGGVPEIVEVGTCGVLGGPGDWKGLAEGVMEMLDDPARMHEMGQAARKRAVEHFGLRDNLYLMANLFRHLLGAKIPGKNLLPGNWQETVPENQAAEARSQVLRKKRVSQGDSV